MISRITSVTPYCAANLGSMARPWLSADKPRNTLAGFQNQKSNATARRLAIRSIEANTFRNVQHPDLRADYVIANPPFNDSAVDKERLKDRVVISLPTRVLK